MNAAQVIGSWWVNFSRSPVGQFCLLVCFALAAKRRTQGVERIGASGAPNADKADSALACPVCKLYPRQDRPKNFVTIPQCRRAG